MILKILPVNEMKYQNKLIGMKFLLGRNSGSGVDSPVYEQNFRSEINRNNNNLKKKENN